jgi:hypothetical protein
VREELAEAPRDLGRHPERAPSRPPALDLEEQDAVSLTENRRRLERRPQALAEKRQVRRLTRERRAGLLAERDLCDRRRRSAAVEAEGDELAALVAPGGREEVAGRL